MNDEDLVAAALWEFRDRENRGGPKAMAAALAIAAPVLLERAARVADESADYAARRERETHTWDDRGRLFSQGCKGTAAAIAEKIRALIPASPPTPTVPRGHCNRCDRCGWDLKATVNEGCVATNCSMRIGPHGELPARRTTCSGCGAPYDAGPATPGGGEACGSCGKPMVGERFTVTASRDASLVGKTICGDCWPPVTAVAAPPVEANGLAGLAAVFADARKHLESLPPHLISSETRAEIARLSATVAPVEANGGETCDLCGGDGVLPVITNLDPVTLGRDVPCPRCTSTPTKGT